MMIFEQMVLAEIVFEQMIFEQMTFEQMILKQIHFGGLVASGAGLAINGS